VEWGSGRSTPWFAGKLKSLLSIEHNEKWHRIVSTKLPPNAECRLIPLNHPEPEPTRPIYDPIPDYVAAVSELEQIDFALIDGHYRQACIRAVLPKLTSGGLLVVDNTDWLPIEEWGIPQEWPIVHQSRNVMTQTTIWKKP
jgi:predicted O-methyltransferase YrrM